MKKIILILFLLIFIIGCVEIQETKITDFEDLILTDSDLNQLEISSNGTICEINEFETSELSPLKKSSTCYYLIDSLNDTEIVIDLKEYTNFHDLNGTYQYSSSHLRSSEGIISENKYGDQSRFSVNHEDDYGSEFNQEGIYYYHLWITKEKFLIHITSKGSEEAKDYILRIGSKILSNFN